MGNEDEPNQRFKTLIDSQEENPDGVPTGLIYQGLPAAITCFRTGYRGLSYYRVKLESQCGNVNNNPIIVKVKPCKCADKSRLPLSKKGYRLRRSIQA